MRSHLPDWINSLGAVAGYLISLGIVGRWMIMKPLHRILTDKVAELMATQEEIREQVAPDEGASLIESVEQLRRQVAIVHRDLYQHASNRSLHR